MYIYIYICSIYICVYLCMCVFVRRKDLELRFYATRHTPH